jgi:hypothetical protein
VTFWVASWLHAFGITLLIETPIAVWMLTSVEPRVARRIAGVVVANLATHPLVWFLFPGLALRADTRLAASEAWAFVAEVAVYLIIWPALRLRRAALISFVANAASSSAGLWLARYLTAH